MVNRGLAAFEPVAGRDLDYAEARIAAPRHPRAL